MEIKAMFVKFSTVMTALFLMTIALTACVPDPTKNEIVHGVVGGKQYFVPKVLFALPHRHLKDDSIYIRTMYPDFTPVLEEQTTLLRKGEWYRNISFLTNPIKSGISFDDFTKRGMEHRKAYEYVKTEFGLLHHKQPEGYVQDKHDMWLEEVDGEYISYISCSEHLVKNDRPQCNHHFFLTNQIHISLSYSKRLLPYWKDIKEQTLELFISFRSEEAAKAYINQKFELLNHHATEGKL